MRAYLKDPEKNLAEEANFEKSEDLRICRWCNFRAVCRPELPPFSKPEEVGGVPPLPPGSERNHAVGGPGGGAPPLPPGSERNHAVGGPGGGAPPLPPGSKRIEVS
jgi:hypothetical protein